MTSKLPINLEDLLHQRKVEGERIEYKTGWNPDPIMRTLCAFANDFENLGGGYVVIGQDCDVSGQSVFHPEFETDDDRSYFLIRLPVHPETVSVESTYVSTTGTAPGKTSGKTSGKILSLMRENPQISIPEIAEAIGRTTRAIEMQVAKLKAEGLIERIGPAKGGHWVVKEDA